MLEFGNGNMESGGGGNGGKPAPRARSQLSAASSSAAGGQDNVVASVLAAAAANLEESSVQLSALIQIDKKTAAVPKAMESAVAPDAAKEQEGEEKEDDDERVDVVCDHETERDDAESARKKKKEKKKKRRRERTRARQASEEQEAATEYLLQYTKQLLRSQALDYEVRGRELEEQNAARAKQIAAAEAKVRKLKRRLHELQYEDEATTRKTPVSYSSEATSQGQSSGLVRAADSLIPDRAAQIEEQVRRTLRERAQSLDEFALGLPRDFKETLEQQVARLVGKDRGIS